MPSSMLGSSTMQFPASTGFGISLVGVSRMMGTGRDQDLNSVPYDPLNLRSCDDPCTCCDRLVSPCGNCGCVASPRSTNRCSSEGRACSCIFGVHSISERARADAVTSEERGVGTSCDVGRSIGSVAPVTYSQSFWACDHSNPKLTKGVKVQGVHLLIRAVQFELHPISHILVSQF